MSTVKLTLDVKYPQDYPDVLPELSLEPTQGGLQDDEVQALIEGLRAVVSTLFAPAWRRVHFIIG